MLEYHPKQMFFYLVVNKSLSIFAVSTGTND